MGSSHVTKHLTPDLVLQLEAALRLRRSASRLRLALSRLALRRLLLHLLRGEQVLQLHLLRREVALVAHRADRAAQTLRAEAV